MNFLTATQKGAFFAIFAGLCYGPIGYFGVVLASKGQTLHSMLFWRALVSVLFSLIIIVPQYKKLAFNLKDCLLAIVYGAVFYNLSTVTYFKASDYIDTGPSMVVFFTFPVVVMLINRFYYKKAIPHLSYWAFALIFTGMLCLVDLAGIRGDLFGLFIGVVAATLYGVYIVVTKNIHMDPVVSTLMVSLGCVVGAGTMTLGTHSLVMPVDAQAWGLIVGLGVISTALPILLLLEGLKYISSDRAAILSVSEPIAVVLCGKFLLGEKTTIMHTIGIGIILAGALMVLLSGTLVHQLFRLKRK